MDSPFLRLLYTLDNHFNRSVKSLKKTHKSSFRVKDAELLI